MTAPLERLVDRHARDRSRILKGLETLLLRMWGRLDPYRGEQVAAFGRDAATAVRAAQVLTAQSTQAYLRSALTVMDTPAARQPVRLPGELRGTPLPVVYERPAKQVRYLESVETPPGQARERGRARLLVLGDDDLQLAAREAARQTLEPVDEVIGYRRVLRPELSESGPCGLCSVASDRLYSKGELLPLHERCKCLTLPMTEGQDPGRSVNRSDLARIYAAAGGTEAARLKRVRVVVHEHGELGPVLRKAGDKFRGPDEAGDESTRAEQTAPAPPVDLDADLSD